MRSNPKFTKLNLILYYRLGTLGFLALKYGVTNGNFGIADQVQETALFILFFELALKGFVRLPASNGLKTISPISEETHRG